MLKHITCFSDFGNLLTARELGKPSAELQRNHLDLLCSGATVTLTRGLPWRTAEGKGCRVRLLLLCHLPHVIQVPIPVCTSVCFFLYL